VSLGQTRYLSLPIPQSTSIATLLLPILTGIGIQISRPLLTQSTNRSTSYPSWLLPALIFILLTIYDTILTTLATTALIPSETQTCLLETRWDSMFHGHDVAALRRIQDTHQCCGLRSMRHKPWPFPDNHGADGCRNLYRNRTGSCLGPWRRDLRVNAGMVLVVAVVCWLVKVITILLIYRRRDNLSLRHGMRRDYVASLTNGDDTEDNGQAAARGRIEAAYRDEVTPEGNEEETVANGAPRRDRDRDGGMVVQPSSMHGHGNEWRN
ncbi:MAG: hypothetical protein Q9205_007861, partial [Flavoplaca limonia]